MGNRGHIYSNHFQTSGVLWESENPRGFIGISKLAVPLEILTSENQLPLNKNGLFLYLHMFFLKSRVQQVSKCCNITNQITKVE